MCCHQVSALSSSEVVAQSECVRQLQEKLAGVVKQQFTVHACQMPDDLERLKIYIACMLDLFSSLPDNELDEGRRDDWTKMSLSEMLHRLPDKETATLDDHAGWIMRCAEADAEWTALHLSRTLLSFYLDEPETKLIAGSKLHYRVEVEHENGTRRVYFVDSSSGRRQADDYGKCLEEFSLQRLPDSTRVTYPQGGAYAEKMNDELNLMETTLKALREQFKTAVSLSKIRNFVAEIL